MEAYRARRKPKSEMNVVPYIDVMLVLLVIFMVTAPMLTPQLVPVTLPKVASEALPLTQPNDVITLSVKENGEYFWYVGSEVNTEDKTDVAVSLEEMKSKIAGLVYGNPHTQIFVRADHQADYGDVVVAMSALQKGGVSQLGLLTEAP